MSWNNFVGAVAKHIPGTTTSRINKINSLAENPAAVSALEQSRVAAGHVMGRAAGGAVIGAGLNGYEYSQTGAGFGGSYSMAESVISGAIAGAIGGGVIGGLGAKAAAKKAVANVDVSNKKIAKLTDKLTNGEGKIIENSRPMQDLQKEDLQKMRQKILAVSILAIEISIMKIEV